MGTFIGDSGNNTLIGTAGDDSLNGLSGNDSLVGNNGNNTLMGGPGNDTLSGGSNGFDLADYSDDTAGVVASLATGVATGAGTGTDLLIGIENLTGGSGNDRLTGGSASSILHGGLGDDTLVGGAGSFQYVSFQGVAGAVIANLNTGTASGTSSGNDVLIGIRNLVGGLGNDLFVGDSNPNSFDGREGNDTLIGGGGDDTLDGGVGIDTVDLSSTTATANVHLEWNSANTIALGNDAIFNVENVLTGGGNDDVEGNDVANLLNAGAGDDTLVGKGGDDTLIGGAGQDEVNYSNDTVGISVNLVTGAAVGVVIGNDVLTGIEDVIGGSGNDTIAGDDQANQLFGGGGFDLLSGGLGADVLSSSLTGGTTMAGGGGNDDYFVGSSADVIAENPGEGIDFVHLFFNATSFVLPDNVEYLSFGGSGATVTANVEDNTLDASNGNDVIFGLGGADLIIPRGGNDFIDGGDGIDTADYIIEGTPVVANLLTGAVSAAASGSDTLVGIEILRTGSGDDSLTGDNGANFLDAWRGNDFLSGAGGDDTLRGDLGNDSLDGGDGNDTAYLWGAKSDYTITRNSDGTYTTTGLGAVADYGSDTLSSIEHIYFTNGGLVDLQQTLSGDAGNNTIVGGLDNDSIDGAPGNDSLSGSDGNDTLEGSDGNDTLDGAFGNDSLRGDSGSGNDSVIGGFGNDTLEGGPGNDTLLGGFGNDLFTDFSGADSVDGGPAFSENDTLALSGTSSDLNTATDAQIVNVESITAAGATASVSIDLHAQTDHFSITGSNFADTLIGGTGGDTFIGFSGADFIDGLSSSFINRLVLAATSPDLNAATNAQIVHVNFISVVGAVAGVSISVANQTEGFNITGGNFADTLTGGPAGDVFTGFTGADFLNGGGGSNTLDLSAAAPDLGNATDAQIVNITNIVAYVAPTGITADIHNQSENFRITATNFNDTIIGGSGDDNIDASAGSDSLQGGGGNDHFTGFLGADSIDGGSGINDLFVNTPTTDLNSASDAQIVNLGSIRVLLAAPVTLDLHNQSDGFNVLIQDFGPPQNDSLIGSAGNDTLDTRSGADTIAGGAGNDYYNVFDSGDVVIENAAAGLDTIQASYGTSYTLGANFEGLIGTAGGFTGVGNTSDNVISTFGGDDLLDGAAGNDTLQGGTGNDTYFTDSAGDIAVENAASGRDTIKTSVSAFALADNFENLVYIGAGNFSGAGNGVANDITGASGGDSLTGGDGNDSLHGGGGNDLLTAGEAGAFIDPYITLPNSQNGLPSASYNQSFSADGSKLVYSGSSIHAPVWLLDIASGAAMRVDTSFAGTAGNGFWNAWDSIAISPDGSKVVFASDATNLVSGDTNHTFDIFVKDLSTGTTTRVVQGSTSDASSPAFNYPAFSPDGGRIIFASTATNLVAADTNNANDIFVADVTTGAVIRVSTASDGSQSNGNFYAGSFSPDGGSVAFMSDATNLVPGDTNATYDVFVKNLSTGAVVRASTAADGSQGNGLTYGAQFAGPSGNKIVFVSEATNLVAGDTNGLADLFVKDLITGATTRIDTTSDGSQAQGGFNGIYGFSVSADGTKVAFAADFSNLAAGTEETENIFLKNLITGEVTCLSVDSDGNPSGGDYPVLSPDGQKVIFRDNYSNLLLRTVQTIPGGSELLRGEDGNDTLIGGNGNDTLDGGNDTDTVIFGGQRSDFTISLNGSTFTVQDNRVGAPDGTDHVTNVEFFQFSDGTFAADDLIEQPPSVPVDSNGSANSVSEGAANGATVGITASSSSPTGSALTYSLLDNAGGRFAINSLSGVVTVANGALLDYEAATSHNITVRVTDTASEYADQNFTIAITNVLGATINGNSSTNVIDGTHTIAGQPLPTGEEDNINGASGNDTINALGGNDTINGGTGSDSMIGGLGNDLYIVDASGDKLLENINQGTDSVQSSVSYTLPSNVEALILTGVANLNATGNSADNSLTGNSGNNILSGLGGADVLDGGAGIDTATYATSLLGVDVSLATGTGSGGDAAGDTLNNIENLTGSNFNDTFEGDGTDNVLTGGNGTDTLSYQHAGAGVTVNLSLTAAQNTGAGTDTITKFENLTGSGFDDSLTGSTANNFLMGLNGNDTLSDNGGNDTLDGGTGADSMAGGGSNDFYVVDNAGDVVTEASGGGTDTIQTAFNLYSLAPIANVENLNFVGVGGFTGSGNGLNNSLTGGSGNDTLDGGTGNDTLEGGTGADSMIGGAGNDTFNVDDGGDTITDTAGTDTVKTILASYTLGANVENLTFTGAGNFTGTGNTLNNTITGGSGNDTLDGGSGNDKLIAGAGDDQLTGSAGNDSLTGGAGADVLTGGVGADKFIFANLSDFVTGPTFDTITDFTHAQTDKIDLSGVDAVDNGIDGGANGTFTFISSAVFSGTGAASAGQLHYVVNGGGGVNVEGDTNGDGVADFTLVVNGVASLAGTDFVL